MVREAASTAVALTRVMEGDGECDEITAPVVPRVASFLVLHHRIKERPTQEGTLRVLCLEIHLQTMSSNTALHSPNIITLWVGLIIGAERRMRIVAST